MDVVGIVTARALLVWRLLRDTAEKYKASIFTELLALGQNKNIQDNDLCHHGFCSGFVNIAAERKNGRKDSFTI